MMSLIRAILFAVFRLVRVVEERNLFRLVSLDGWYGQLEVYHDSQWGTICNINIGDSEAKAACEALGLTR